MFTNPVLAEIGKPYNKSAAQVVLRWNIERKVSVIPKSVHKERMEQNLDIWDFELSKEDLEKIAKLDLGKPQMLDTRKPSEVKRVYDFLKNPVITTL